MFLVLLCLTSTGCDWLGHSSNSESHRPVHLEGGARARPWLAGILLMASFYCYCTFAPHISAKPGLNPESRVKSSKKVGGPLGSAALVALLRASHFALDLTDHATLDLVSWLRAPPMFRSSSRDRRSISTAESTAESTHHQRAHEKPQRETTDLFYYQWFLFCCCETMTNYEL
jgi:hypothetical protein